MIFFVRLEDYGLYVFESKNKDEAFEHVNSIFDPVSFDDQDIVELDGELFARFKNSRVYVRPE